MKKKILKNINDNLNQENTINFFLPPTKTKKINKSKSNSKSKINNETQKQNIILSSPNNNITENSKIIQKSEIGTNKTQSKSKKSKPKNIKTKIITELNIEKPIIQENKNKINIITINEVENKKVPKFSKLKNGKKFTSKYLFFIFRRKAYPYTFNPKSKINDLYNKLSNELKIDKNCLEFRINDKIINKKDEEKLVKDFIDEEKNDIIYVTKTLPNYNLINNLYNKAYDNLVIIENSFEISEIEKKLNKFLEEYNMEKDYYFKKLDNNKYSFGFSYPDFAFDFNRLLLILKRTENDFKDIKSYLKLDKKKNKQKYIMNSTNNNN